VSSFGADMHYSTWEDPEEAVEDTDPSDSQGTLLEISYHFQRILNLLGEDIYREGLKDTPERIAKAWLEFTSGLHQDPDVYLEKTFTVGGDDMIIVKDIPFNSICEHHFVPFVGSAHIGYIPGSLQGDLKPPYKVAGLSKFPRLVQGYASRPQIQEQLTDQIADSISRVLKPQGVIVCMTAQHMCMSLRGVKSVGSTTVTSSVRGLFNTNQDGVKQEFFELLRMK
jgi:GTP cyclohydrolase IA